MDKANLQRVPVKYGKFFRELGVIFASIMLAFLVDDYRENRNQLNGYKEVLMNFELELLENIESKSNLDTFKVATDKIGGWKFARLLDLLWLDSLLDNKAATLSDFRFILETDKLSAELYGGYGPSPLSEEIRIKYGEYIRNDHLLNYLRIYDEEMRILQRLQQSLWDSHQSFGNQLEKTNPYYNFGKNDSLLFYSNEFIWRYKEIVDAREQEYYYTKWLFQNRFVRVLDEVHKEFEALSIPISEEWTCLKNDNYHKRFECHNGRKIERLDSLKNNMDLVKKARKNYRTQKLT